MNYDYYRLSRIWFCWGPSVTVTLLHKSAQIVTRAVQSDVGDQFIFSAIYASNFISDRRHLWADIRATHQAYQHLSMPWILIGDYNAILSSTENSRANDYLRDQSGMLHFQELVTDCVLTDLAYIESLFILWNKRGADPIGKKLDHALINGDWLRVYPQSFALFEMGGISDHARCVVRLKHQSSGNRKLFKFFKYLAEQEEFLFTVKSKWEATDALIHSRTAFNMFHQKLKSLKFALRKLNRNHYGDLHLERR